jgi:stringent starvation protein B
MDIDKLTPRRPYLVRAFYEWLVDNELTPHLVVDATLPGVQVPEEFIQDGQIILNIAPRAVGNLEMSNEAITFNARFGGKPHSVIAPLYAVHAIYARENGAGTMFEPEDGYIGAEESLVDKKSEDVGFEVVGNVPDSEPEDESNQLSSEDSVRPKGRPSLRVVK